MEKAKIFKKFKNLVAVVIGKEKKKKIFEKFNLKWKREISLFQKHTTKIFIVNKSFPKKIGDGLITKEKDLLLKIRVADCLPIFFFDPKKEIIGLIHAGWRGTLKEISKKAVLLFKNLGSYPKDILVWIGPSIGKCCYEVKEDLIKKFSKTFPDFKRKIIFKRGGKYFLDLKETNRLILLKEGLKKKNIEISPICTFCNKNYFSFRREKKLKEENLAIFCQKSL